MCAEYRREVVRDEAAAAAHVEYTCAPRQHAGQLKRHVIRAPDEAPPPLPAPAPLDAADCAFQSVDERVQKYLRITEQDALGIKPVGEPVITRVTVGVSRDVRHRLLHAFFSRPALRLGNSWAA